tara:strand:- start:649 stop:1278 length:630 start_codon:yes stop_codon:yes gene_type:complete
MIRQMQRRTVRKRKMQKKFLRDDDEEDFDIGGLLGAGLSFLSGSQSKPSGYDISTLPQMQQYEAGLNEQLGLSRAYMDPNSRQNQLMRSGMMGQNMNMIGLQNQFNARNPNIASGITGAQNRATTQQGISGALGQYQQGLQGNISMGMGALGRGMQQYGDLASMYGQQYVQNKQDMDKWRADQWGGIGELGIGLLTHGLSNFLPQVKPV